MKSSTAKRTKTLPRLPASATAETLLAAGERVVTEYVRRGPSKNSEPIDILAFVRIEDVLHEATQWRRQDAEDRGTLPKSSSVTRLTPGAFYRAFPPSSGKTGPRRKGEAFTAFRRELGRRLIMTDRYRSSAEEAFREIQSGTPAEWRQAVRVAVTGEYQRWLDSPEDCLFYALILHARDPEIAAWLGATNQRELDFFEEYYRKGLPTIGRQCKPGVTERHLASVIRSMVAGLALHARIPDSPTNDRVPTPDAGGGPDDGPLIATLAIEAVFEGLTERIPTRRRR